MWIYQLELDSCTPYASNGHAQELSKSYPLASVWQVQHEADVSTWMGQSLGADGGSLSGTGYPHWSGTNSSDAKQTAPSHNHEISETEI